MELYYYNNYIFNTNNHKLIRLSDDLITHVKEVRNIKNFWNIINNLEIKNLNDTIKNQIEIFLFSSSLYSQQNIEQNSKILNNCTQLQFLVTNTCNLKCKYCYANEGTYNKNIKFMSFPTIVKTLNIFFNKYDYIDTIMFFGGEPLLNDEVIKKACAYLNKNYKGRYGIINIMSNLYELSDNMIDFIKKYSINIATSMDGYEKDNDLNRLNKSNSGTYDKVNKNILRLKKETNQPIKIQATVCANSEEKFLEKKFELMKQFSTDYGIQLTTINKVQDFKNNKIQNPRNNKFQDSRNNLFNNLTKKDIEFESSNFIKEIKISIDNKILTDQVLRFYYFLIGQKNKYRCKAGLCSFSVFPDGEITPCQLFALDKSKEYSLGNIELLNNKNLKNFKNVQNSLESKLNKDCHEICKNCIAKDICLSCVGTTIEFNRELYPIQEECQETILRYLTFIKTYIYLYENPQLYRDFIINTKKIIDNFNFGGNYEKNT